jgi:hypothetical protein
MIPNRLNLNSHRNLRLAGILLALLALLGGAAYLFAQSDTPIVINDGSLFMESRVVGWPSFRGDDNAHTHPNTASTVNAVDLTVQGASRTITFNNEKVEVDVTCTGSFPIKVTTDSTGKNLAIATNFRSFRRGADDNHLVHTNAAISISHVTVLKNGAQVFDSAANGHSSITIHYTQ